MSEKYRGKADDRRYTGEKLDIQYNGKRCIHAEECVKRLAGVFDTKRKPWILPDEGDAATITSELINCPSGALHFEAKDGNTEEIAPENNRIIIWHNGPLQLHGNLAIEGAAVSIESETRATLCRCGASQNKPFCDNSHKEIGFEAEEIASLNIEEAESGGKLLITANHQGPLQIEGNFTIESEDGKLLYRGKKAALCRCGHSKRKPFCDSSHKTIGFEAD
jgi:CDGSH-type Zn-finger protein/uncharacterized Fe-S cluster protein YjdI